MVENEKNLTGLLVFRFGAEELECGHLQAEVCTLNSIYVSQPNNANGMAFSSDTGDDDDDDGRARR